MASSHISLLAHTPSVWQAAGIAQAPRSVLGALGVPTWRGGGQQHPHCSELDSGSASSLGLPGQGAEHTAAFIRAIKHKDLQRAKKMRQRCKGEKGEKRGRTPNSTHQEKRNIFNKYSINCQQDYIFLSTQKMLRELQRELHGSLAAPLPSVRSHIQINS